MIFITDIIIIALSLSVDAFFLATSYGIIGVSMKKSFITALSVGIFHFFMPLLGNVIGLNLFSYISIKPKIVLSFVFLFLSLNMLISFFDKAKTHNNLNLVGIIVFALSVSIDSFTVGLGINYFCDNIFLACLIFCLVSFSFTMLGFIFGKQLYKKFGKLSFLVSSVILLIYALRMLTK